MGPQSPVYSPPLPTGEEEADYRENSVTLSDGTFAWRVFEFDGWGNVLGG